MPADHYPLRVLVDGMLYGNCGGSQIIKEQQFY